MNVHSGKTVSSPTSEEVKEAIKTITDWINKNGKKSISHLEPQTFSFLEKDSYPLLSRTYPKDFEIDENYRAGLPDIQNAPSPQIRGGKYPIQHVGISNFRLPLKFSRRDDNSVELETSVTGTVSLEAAKKGINMSRIIRSFYHYSEKTFGFEVLDSVLNDYKIHLECLDARILMKISYPLKVSSLRSRLEGVQYYDIALEIVEKNGERLKILHLDYVYSSTCPCSLELSEHARKERAQLATPHSQRSIARVSVQILGSQTLWFEDLIDFCRGAIPTETQVMVKREDEQAFAELNAANPIFVEDASRSICAVLKSDKRIGDFRIIACHQESLHSYDAISLLTEGPTFEENSLDPKIFSSLVLNY